MGTIAPGRLHDVSNAADFVALTQTNFEILTAEVFKQEPTYVSGVPATNIGPPTTGSHVLNEIWKDALGGVFKCTAAGTPGTWKQILPAAVPADPATGTIPTGYLILNVTQGTLKRHAGGYAWETQIGGSVSARIGFWGATPVVQPSGANQAAVTLGNTDGEIGGLTISDPPTPAEVQALRDKTEELADAHLPTPAGIKRVAAQAAEQFHAYTNARVTAKARLANFDFDAMTYEDKRNLCETVFSGKTADGKRMGVVISWSEDGKKWRYRIEGHVIDASGPIGKNAFVFGAAPGQKALVTKSSSSW